MSQDTVKIYNHLIERLEKPCSCCNKIMRLCELRLEGIGFLPVGLEDKKVLYFTHMLCKSTMVAMEKKAA